MHRVNFEHYEARHIGRDIETNIDVYMYIVLLADFGQIPVVVLSVQKVRSSYFRGPCSFVFPVRGQIRATDARGGSLHARRVVIFASLDFPLTQTSTLQSIYFVNLPPPWALFLLNDDGLGTGQCRLWREDFTKSARDLLL